MSTLRSDAALNRERLLAAADAVFAQRGLQAGVEEIAQRAGVGVGTLYRRFPTKDALIAELVHDVLARVLDDARAALDAPAGTGLERFLYATAATQATHRGYLVRLWNDENTDALRADIRAVMSQLLEQAHRSGTVRDDARAADLDLLFWSLPGVIEAAGGREAVWLRHVELFVAGLRPPASRPS